MIGMYGRAPPSPDASSTEVVRAALWPEKSPPPRGLVSAVFTFGSAVFTRLRPVFTRSRPKKKWSPNFGYCGGSKGDPPGNSRFEDTNRLGWATAAGQTRQASAKSDGLASSPPQKASGGGASARSAPWSLAPARSVAPSRTLRPQPAPAALGPPPSAARRATTTNPRQTPQDHRTRCARCRPRTLETRRTSTGATACRCPSFRRVPTRRGWRSRRWTRAAVEAVLRRFGRSPPYFKRGRICPVAIAALGPSISGQTRTSWPTGGVRDDHARAQTHLHSYCTYRSAPRIHTQRTSNNKRKNNAISGFKKNICMGRCVCSIAGNRTHGCR